MKNKQCVTKIIAFFCVVVFFSLFCIRVYSLNTRFPPTKIENYSCGETVNIDTKGKYTNGKTVENIFQLIASDFKIYTPEELIREHQLKDNNIPEDRFPQYKKKVLLLKVCVKNMSDTEQVLELYNIPVQCTQLLWSSSVSLEWFKMLNANNPKMSLQPSLKPKESLTLFLPYTIYNDNITDNTFNKIDKMKVDLVLSLYPKKKLINLNY